MRVLLRIIGRILDMPWKARNEAARVLLVPFARLYLRVNGVRWGRGWRVYGRPVVQRHRGSRISIGDDLDLRSWFSSNPLGVSRCFLTTWNRGASIEIGTGVKATGVVICATERIEIGADVRLGAGTMIIDTDFHPLTAQARAIDPRAGVSAPVTIGAGVFIGTRSTILKGTRIGPGAVIGAGSVVTGEVPANTLVAGNPARPVRTI